MARVIDSIIRLKDSFTPTLRAVGNNLEQHSKMHRRLGGDIESTGKAISGLSSKMALLSVPLMGAATAGFKLSQNLDKSMARVSTRVDTTIVDMQKMKREMLQLSNDTGVAVETLAQAQDKVMIAGVKAGESMKFLAENIKLTKVSQLDLSTSTDVMTTHLKAYNMQTEHMHYINDKLIVGSRIGKVSTDQMGLAMMSVAKNAADAGVNINQLYASYAIMTQKGTESAAASGALNALFESFAKASPKAIKAARDYGIELNRAHIQAVGFPAFLQEIQDKTGGSEEAIGKIIKDVDAFKLSLQITGSGAENFNEVMQQIENSTSATAETLGKLKTPAGATTKALNMLRNAGVELVDGLEPLFNRSAIMITQMVNAFNSLSKEQKEMIFSAARAIVIMTIFSGVTGKAISTVGSGITKIADLSDKISKAGGTVSYLSNRFSTLISVFKYVGTAAKFLFMSPIGLAILAVCAAAFLIYKYWEPIKEFFIKLWASVVAIFNGTVTAIKTYLEKCGVDFSKFTSIFELSKGLFSAWCNFVVTIWTVIFTVAKVVFLPLYILFSAVFKAIAAIIYVVWLGISAYLKFCWNNLIIMAMVVVNMLIGAFTGFSTGLGQIINGVMDIFSGLITFITGVLSADWGMAWQGLVQIFSGIFATIGGICKSTMNGIIGIINGAIQSMNGINVDIPGWVPVVGGQSYAVTIPEIPMLANGTENWRGGPAMIHDAGPEIVDLPSGSRVIPHSQSMRQEYERGRKAGTGDININIPKLAETLIVREDADIDKIVEKLAFKLKSYAINQAEGAI